MNPRLIYFCHDHLAEQSPDPAFVQSACIIYARGVSTQQGGRVGSAHTPTTESETDENSEFKAQGTNCINIHSGT